MTAINLALRTLYGHVIWGNSLANERRRVYRNGFNLRGFVRELGSGETVPGLPELGSDPTRMHSGETNVGSMKRRDEGASSGQLHLF